MCLLGLSLLDYTWTMKMYSYWVYQKRHLASEIAYSDCMWTKLKRMEIFVVPPSEPYQQGCVWLCSYRPLAQIVSSWWFSKNPWAENFLIWPKVFGLIGRVSFCGLTIIKRSDFAWWRCQQAQQRCWADWDENNIPGTSKFPLFFLLLLLVEGNFFCLSLPRQGNQ